MTLCVILYHFVTWRRTFSSERTENSQVRQLEEFLSTCEIFRPKNYSLARNNAKVVSVGTRGTEKSQLLREIYLLFT